jgi:hypothetical protein
LCPSTTGVALVKTDRPIYFLLFTATISKLAYYTPTQKPVSCHMCTVLSVMTILWNLTSILAVTQEAVDEKPPARVPAEPHIMEAHQMSSIAIEVHLPNPWNIEIGLAHRV